MDLTNGWAYAELGVVLNNWDWDSIASRNISTTHFACISLALGDIVKTKDYLEQALEERDGALHEIDHLASFYAHKNEPWLKEIIDRSWLPFVDSKSETEEIN